MAKKLEPAFTAARDGKAPERERRQSPDVPTRIKKHASASKTKPGALKPPGRSGRRRGRANG